MLFTSRFNRDSSSLRGDSKRKSQKGIKSQLSMENKTDSQAILAERRRQLMRRHTCGVLDPEEVKGGGIPKSYSVSPKRTLASIAGSSPSGSVRRRGSSIRRKKSYDEAAIPEEGSQSPTRPSGSGRAKHSSISEELPFYQTSGLMYFQILEGGGGGPPPDMPPPPLPDDLGGTGLPDPSSGGFPPHSNQNGSEAPYISEPETDPAFPIFEPKVPSEPVDDGYDYDWSDEESVANHETPAGVSKGSSGRRSTRDMSTDDEDHGYTPAQRGRSGTNASSERDDSREERKSVSGSDYPSSRKASVKKRGSDAHTGSSGGRELSRSGQDISRGATIKKNINRFSNFVKSGAEAYIISNPKINGPPSETHEIIVSRAGPEWKSPEKPYLVNVDKPKKERKLKGLKSFIAYQLTPSFTGIQVSRRYKHFDWLHQRMTEKYTFLPIPPLPEKQATGRYEEEFIEHRMQLLHLWVSKIVRHPVLSRSEVWLHFLTCTDEKKWKQGKRKAEKDEYIGGNFFMSITVPPQPLDQTETDAKLENFHKLTRSLDDSIKGFHACAGEASKKMAGPYKREWDKMGMAFKSLGQSMEIDQAEQAQGITAAVKKTAESYYRIGKMYEEQPRKDLEPLQDNLFAYKGLLSSVPDILQVHKSAMSKLRDHEKMNQEGKLPPGELDNIRSRVDTMSYSMLAEMNHFQSERVVDFKSMFSEYLKSQVGFYEQIVAELKGAVDDFERA